MTQEFMTAEQLGLQPLHYEALKEVLHRMESGKFIQWQEGQRISKTGEKNLCLFNMNFWVETNEAPCGTVGCIGGWAELVISEWQGKELKINIESEGFMEHTIFNRESYNRDKYDSLWELFYPESGILYDNDVFSYENIKMSQAAQALRNYLNTGKPSWDLVFEAAA